MTVIDERPAPLTGREAAGYDAARRAMIDSQLRTSGVNEPWVLARMAILPREDFVPEPWRSAAYIDRAVPLGDGHFLSAPLVYGRILGEARPRRDDAALVVSASGYLAELLSPLVDAVELVAPADGAAGSVKTSEATLLLIDGAIEQLPAALTGRLTEGARVVCGIIELGVTRLAVGRKTAGEVTFLPLAEIGIPVLPEFAAPRRWSF